MNDIVDVSSLTPLTVNVEEDLMRCLSMEVATYAKALQGSKCRLCPFRSLSSLRYLRAHLNYHSPENLFMADRRSPQRAVIRAYYDYLQASAPAVATVPTFQDLLHYSAAIIEKWNVGCTSATLNVLRK